MKLAAGGQALLLACLVSSCTTAAPQAPLEQNVRVTRAETDVVGCRTIRLVEAKTQFGTEDSEKNGPEIMKEMRRETATLGGNVLFLRPGRKLSGVAYSCGAAPAFQS